MNLLAILRQTLSKIGLFRPNLAIALSGAALVGASLFAYSEPYLNYNQSFDRHPIGLVNKMVVKGELLLLVGEIGLVRKRRETVDIVDLAAQGIMGYLTGVAVDSSSNIWVSSLGDGLAKINPDSMRVEQVVSETVKRCWEIKQSSSGDTLAACGGSIYRINPLNTQDLIPLTAEAQTEIEIAGFDFLGHDKVIFQNTLGELTVFNLTTKISEKVNLPFDYASSIFVDNESRVWISDDFDVFVKYPTENSFTHVPRKRALPTSMVFGFLQTNNGKILSYGTELLEFNEENHELGWGFIESRGLSASNIQGVSAIAEELNGKFYVFVNGKGLGIIDTPVEAIKVLRGPDSGFIEDITASEVINQEVILIGSKRDLLAFNIKTHKTKFIHRFDGYITSISLLDNDTLVLAVDGDGLYQLDGSINLDENYAKFSKIWGERETDVSNIIQLPDGAVILGAQGGPVAGLYRGSLSEGFSRIYREDVDSLVFSNQEYIIFSSRDGSFHKLNEDNLNKIPSKYEVDSLFNYCLKGTIAGRIFSCSNGLGVIEVADELKYLTLNKPEIGRFIRDIVVMSDYELLIASNTGLFYFNLSSDSLYRLESEDGVFDVDFELGSSLKISEQRALIAGDKYTYIIELPELRQQILERQQQTHRVKLRWESSGSSSVSGKLDGAGKSSHGPITLASGSSLKVALSFHDMIKKELVGFEYRIQDIAPEWSAVSKSSPQIFVPQLAAGQYIIEVRATDPKSIAKQPVSTLVIDYLAPWYLTWYAYLLYFAGLALLLAAAYKYRIHRLKSANKTLETAVAARTEELTQSNNQIAALMDKKDSMFAHVSHEFRTPLTLIEAPIDLLSESADEQGNALIDVVKRNTARLNHLVEQVLELARLDQSKQLPHYQYNVAETFSFIVDVFRPYAEQRRQELVFVSEYDGIAALTEDCIEKVLSNLLLNAIKYTAPGGCILVKTSPLRNGFSFYVKDNGIGIAESDLSRVFERFERSSSPDDNELGSGLGLAVVRELVVANKGTIDVESKVGVGSIFTVSFPKASEKPPSDQIAKPNERNIKALADLSSKGSHTDESVDTDASKQVALIIDDSADMRKILKDIFDNTFSCLLAENGGQGLEMAIEQVPDIIVCDVMMPVKDGFSVLASLRQNESTSHIPVILLTAKGDEKSRLEGLELQADDYIAKPFSRKEILVRAKRLLSIRALLSKRNGTSLQITTTDDEKVESKLGFSSEKDTLFYERFVSVIESHYKDVDFNRAAAASYMAVSERQLNRKLSALVDHNFSDYLRRYRLRKAHAALYKGRQVTEVVYDVGFSSPSYFSSCFKAEFGVTPKECAQQGNVK